MDITSPDNIALDEVTLELISDARALALQVNERRPLPPEVVQNIQKELLSERVYNSNAIEGNTLTLRETKSVLETGSIVDVGRKREVTEAINLGKAIAEVQKLIDDRDLWCDFDEFLSVHETLLKNWKDHAAGRIRSERVILTGAKHQPPRPEKLNGLLEEFFRHLKSSAEQEKLTDPIVLATWTHWVIARIHPFEDGNGRMARLWQDLILFGHTLTASVIRQQDRTEYYDALAAADDGDFNPLTQLVTRSLNRTLQVYVNAQREVDELKDWAEIIVGETKARVDEKRKLEYLRWTHEMEQLRDAFERCATQITNASDGSVEVQVKSFDIVDQSTWETLRSGSRASQTWFFWINFRQGSARAQYCFFFGQHWSVEADLEVPEIGPGTALLVSEQTGQLERPVRLEEIRNCPLTLREILVVNDKLTRKRIDLQLQKEVYELDIDPLKVAREFLQEVFMSRLN